MDADDAIAASRITILLTKQRPIGPIDSGAKGDDDYLLHIYYPKGVTSCVYPYLLRMS